jgi:hypothetical protein
MSRKNIQLRATKVFRDINDDKLRKRGELFMASEKRAKEILAHKDNLAEVVEIQK